MARVDGCNLTTPGGVGGTLHGEGRARSAVTTLACWATLLCAGAAGCSSVGFADDVPDDGASDARDVASDERSGKRGAVSEPPSSGAQGSNPRSDDGLEQGPSDSVDGPGSGDLASGDESGPSTPSAPGDKLEPTMAGVGVFTRLTRRQYDETVFAAFGVHPDLSGIPEDGRVGPFTSNAGATTEPAHAYLLAAEDLAVRIVPDELPTCGDDVRACVDEHYVPAIRELFRRSATAVEVDGWVRMVDESLEVGLSPLEATRMLVGALLISPDFLYRSVASASGEVRLGERLAYALWEAPPNVAELSATSVWSDEQTVRLLADHRSATTLARFFAQWLDVDVDLRREDPQFESSPQYLEWLAFVDDVITQQRPVTSLLTSGFGFVHPDNAASYAVAVPSGDGPQRVEWPAASSRRGVLGQELIADSTRHPDASRRVIFRGLLVRRALLCDPVPAPSAELVALAGEVVDRTEDARCAGCHQRLDPIGAAFSALDLDGERLSARVIGHDELEGEYADLPALLEAVAGSRAFAQCFARHWLTFLLELEPDAVDPAWELELAERVLGGATLTDVLDHTARTLEGRYESFVPWCEVSP